MLNWGMFLMIGKWQSNFISLLLPSSSCLGSTSSKTFLLLITEHHFPSTYQPVSLSLFPPVSLKISFMLWSTKVTHLTPSCRDCSGSFTLSTKSHQSRKLFSLCEWQGNYQAEWHGQRSAFTLEAIATAETSGRKAVTDWHPLAYYYGPCVNEIEAMTVTAFLINKVLCQ